MEFTRSVLDHSEKNDFIRISDRPPRNDIIFRALLFCLLHNTFALSSQRRQSVPPSDPQTCLQTSSPNFDLLARYKDSPSSTVPVKVIDVNTVPKVTFSVLSSCVTCSSNWAYNTLVNGGILPKSTSNPNLQCVSLSLLEGESPTFVTRQYPPPPYPGYCMTANVIDSTGPLVLAGNGRSDLWSLCPNSTASGRVDVVWSPKENHAHYLKSNCRDVYLERV
ncbi:hypothetical protein Hypma_012960 [Hypsizygus marmoreus]|uniref:Uncharacterized protein n=1 Tax=Hypsizygus marmoreus TaxID=39966 RepID=A0A369JJM8_HYPMA|nr:hypothetical protein Hypma_012960 [Hypsizygus marmoreus]